MQVAGAIPSQCWLSPGLSWAQVGMIPNHAESLRWFYNEGDWFDHQIHCILKTGRTLRGQVLKRLGPSLCANKCSALPLLGHSLLYFQGLPRLFEGRAAQLKFTVGVQVSIRQKVKENSSILFLFSDRHPVRRCWDSLPFAYTNFCTASPGRTKFLM